MADGLLKELPADWDYDDVYARIKYQLRTGDLKRRAYRKVRDELNAMSEGQPFKEEDVKKIYQGPR